MDELRFVRREEHSLIVANDADEEFRFVVDDAALLELRHLAKRQRETAKVSPREIQTLIRAGKTRAQVAALTGLDEVVIERYEEPVLAERRYILERAHAVPVRTDSNGDTDQRFGAVIAERLVSLGAEASEWTSWRDAENGWMISLEFISHDVAHRAVWSFEHRKATLSPDNPDAVNLSKQGDVGDRLIPKLRVVDDGESSGRFDSGAFDAEQLRAEADAGETEDTSESAPAADQPAVENTNSPSLVDPDAEYARRREIDQRAIKTDAAGPADLSQTADLLDALRRRRGERELRSRQAETQLASEEALDDLAASGSERRESAESRGDDRPVAAPRSIWAGAATSQAERRAKRSAESAPAERSGGEAAVHGAQGTEPTGGAPREAEAGKPESEKPESERQARKGRASIPSWDDILFGTRSDEDPA